MTIAMTLDHPGKHQRSAWAGGVRRERPSGGQHDLGGVLRCKDRGLAHHAQPRQGKEGTRHDGHQGVVWQMCFL